jgi:hypothetical protein
VLLHLLFSVQQLLLLSLLFLRLSQSLRKTVKQVQEAQVLQVLQLVNWGRVPQVEVARMVVQVVVEVVALARHVEVVAAWQKGKVVLVGEAVVPLQLLLHCVFAPAK